jgi:cysteinyl-tRNA synthetase
MLLPYLSVLSKFRDEVRSMAKTKQPHDVFLKLTDKLRDEDLVALDVLLDDREDGNALVKFVDKEILIREREEKKMKEAEKLLKKEEAQRLVQIKLQEKLNKAKILPEDLFKDVESLKLYGRWDDLGVPTHTIDGVEVTKSKRKKLQSAHDQHVKLHQEWKNQK